MASTEAPPRPPRFEANDHTGESAPAVTLAFAPFTGPHNQTSFRPSGGFPIQPVGGICLDRTLTAAERRIPVRGEEP